MPDTLQSQYAVQIQSDLQSNVAEHERITDEIGVLQEQLTVLEANHALLTAMQQTLGTPARSSVARARKKKSSEPAPGGGRVPRARTSAETPGTGAKKQRRNGKPQARGKGPTLRDLVAAHLTEADHPASAAEITTTLAAAHPERNIAATVVRNTLENLVAKSLAERTRQRRSVYYSRPAMAGADAQARPEAAVSGEEEAATSTATA
ncbi:hypothetical protein ACIBCO_40570 [Streptomyces violascens]|uniref:hypothetical protein n=1 Tax=Streptomyces violascens TaxID=67381 RepID=UPI0037AA3A37